MQMSTLRGWHGGHQEEAPKVELRRLTPKGRYCSLSVTLNAHIFLPLNESVKLNKLKHHTVVLKLTVSLLMCHLVTHLSCLIDNQCCPI